MALTGAAELIAYVERVAEHAPEAVQQRALELMAAVLEVQGSGLRSVQFGSQSIDHRMIRSAWTDSGAAQLCAPWRQVPAHVVPLPGESA